jgi:hypothetical protein
MTPECTITVRSPAELLAVTPYVLGFHPADSVVVIGMDGRSVAFGARYDLPPPQRDDSEEIAAIVAAQPIQMVTVIGYGPPIRVTPVVLRLAHALTGLGVRVDDVLRVTDGRWWSYVCDNPRCCPPEGKPCHPPDNAIAAQAVFRGQVALPDRQALVGQVAAVTGAARAAMVAATARARARMTDLAGNDLRDRRAGRLVRRAGRVAVQEAEQLHRAERPLTDDQVAWLGVLLVNGVVYDYALDRSDRQEWRIRLWTEVVRRVDPAYVAAPASLLGFAAWRAGQGALARVAVDRALKEAPGHRMAGMLDHLLCSGIGPQAVAALSPPLGSGSATRVRPAGRTAGRAGRGGMARRGAERRMRRAARRRSL